MVDGCQEGAGVTVSCEHRSKKMRGVLTRQGVAMEFYFSINKAMLANFVGRSFLSTIEFLALSRNIRVE